MIDLGQSTERIAVHGHRGIRALYPENTMVSFRAAVSSGVDGIETDINVTRDGVPVIIHDNTLERTTDGKGRVRDLTLGEIKRLDAGGFFSPKFAGERIPTLTEFLELVAPTKLYLNLEIKDYTIECADKVVKAIDEFGLRGRVVVTSGDANIMQYVHAIHGLPTQGFPINAMKNPSGETYAHMSAVGVGMPWLDTSPSAAEFRAMGIDYWTWCPDDEEGVRRSIAAGASLVTCNDPFPALKLLRELGLHD